jgi:hypothetical protein
MSEKPKQILPLATPDEVGLGARTIMDRTLARQHGSAYVQLSVFAIDLDRVYTDTPAAESLPFGFEVFLTEARICQLALDAPETLAMLSALTGHVLSQPADDQGYGSQVVFAVFDLIARGRLPRTLQELFSDWRGKPKQLARALDGLWQDAERALPELAQACLAAELLPPLAPPTCEALSAMTAELGRTLGPGASDS